MKKQLLFLLLAPMMLTSVAGCTNKSGMKLTYGTYVTEAENEKSHARIIERGDLALKMDENSQFSNENFLLVVAPTNGCACWSTFQPILKQYVDETHYLVYQITVDELASGDSFGINYKQGHVSFVIVKNGSIYKQYISSPIFDSLTSFKAEIDKYVNAPNLYYASIDQLDTAIKANQETLLVDYVWGSCSDCQYALPNSLFPLANNNTFTKKMYIVDLDNIKDNEGEYKAFRASHYMSNALDTDFGYDRGFVPTIHCYERGKIIDATVYFNDEVSLVDGQYMVTRSFYSNSRMGKLKYLSGVKTTVLEGLILSENDVNVYDLTEKGKGIFYSWKHESADKYHKPLFDAFMKKYAL